MTPDVVASYDEARPQADYVKRVVMVPMRDGVKLYTVIVMKKGANNAPILLSRTPYDAKDTTARTKSQLITEILPAMDAEFVEDNYIRVYQDIRGLHNSEGEFVMTRPIAGPLNTTGIDESTDAYDTIDWLVKNVPESNGKVGVVGSSYLGFTTLMAEINPHPALKAAAPQSPMVDTWIGDDCLPQRRLPQSHVGLRGGAEHGKGRGRRPGRWRGRRLHALSGSRLGRRLRPPVGHRPVSVHTKLMRKIRPIRNSGRCRRWTSGWRRGR